MIACLDYYLYKIIDDDDAEDEQSDILLKFN